MANFRTYWDGCDDVENPAEARKQLLAKIVDKVFVYDQTVLAVALHGDFSIVLDNGTSAPHEVVEGLKMEIAAGKEKGASDFDSTCTLDGSDGHTLSSANFEVQTERHIRSKCDLLLNLSCAFDTYSGLLFQSKKTLCIKLLKD